MAVSTSFSFDGVNAKVIEVTADNDADTTTGAIPHGFQEQPVVMGLAALDQVAAAASQWAVAAIDGTNITLTKTGGAAGSGAAGAQVQVMLVAANAPRIG